MKVRSQSVRHLDVLALVGSIVVPESLLIPGHTLKQKGNKIAEMLRSLQTHLHINIGFHDCGSQEQHLGSALVQLTHLHRLAEDLTPLVHVLGQ